MIPYFWSRIYRRQNFSCQKISNNNNNLWTLSQAHFIFMIYFNYTCIMHSTFDCFISFQMSSNDGIETLVMTSPNASVQENGNSHPVTHEVPLDIKTVPPVEVPPIPASPPKVESSVSVDETQNEVKPVPPSSSVLPINTKPASEILTHAEEKQKENNVHEVQEKEKSNEEGDVAEEKKIQKEEIEERREAELRITVEERKEDEERKETKERKEDKEHKEDEERKQKDEEHKEVKERKQENEEEKQDEERKQEDEKREEDERKEDEEIREEDEGRKDVEVVSSPRKRKKRQYSIKELNNSSAEKREFVFHILKNKIEKLLFVI